ncbi:MAG TPA: inorganic pyrophosphatase [Burkholderiales bacterium]|nr:inorganic pyrophosphatase [Burkholderiales bacterium]
MTSSLRFSQWRPHPWHGLPTGREPPVFVNAYIEITPFDLIKYEVDKASGYLRVDRPQRGSSQTPALYGFIPQTYCGENVKSLCPGAERGDGDPLDICVISERPIDHSEIIVPARVVGGLQLLDHGEADDKIIAVLENDLIWGSVGDVADLPHILVERLRHYFSTYKLVSGQEPPIVIRSTYGREDAIRVIKASMEDYMVLRSSDPG